VVPVGPEDGLGEGEGSGGNKESQFIHRARPPPIELDITTAIITMTIKKLLLFDII
jgi:hypothetical protein